ncbi:hypothetical protein AB833_09615 [Chromatiales bacterium (ex Bugula neritina AB1)]|nr:hypothetical protein AB833_09615 [Chromatiales bacterium (ex Bugula neritina AB1)]
MKNRTTTATRLYGVIAALLISLSGLLKAETLLPIADTHVHYSHDSVDLTPPERVIEIMRSANLKFALVSSSDDNGTRLLSQLAPELIVPGLRPYRRRGELGTWFKDQAALQYVERLLETNAYATIGEFHLFGRTAELPIPRRIVELADEYNLILHAHSDAEAVELLLAQNANIKVLWAHSGFEWPEEIGRMLRQHDRLWADLAFRSEVGSGGRLSEEWINLFTEFPHKMMLGTDTYTPERMYFIPENADAARIWLAELPEELAINIAWRNAYNLLMPVWQLNRQNHKVASESVAGQAGCDDKPGEEQLVINTDKLSVRLHTITTLAVSVPQTIEVMVCGEKAEKSRVILDASMPAHGHGMNYQPEHVTISRSAGQSVHRVEGIVLHMPGTWQWNIEVDEGDHKSRLTHQFDVQ